MVVFDLTLVLLLKSVLTENNVLSLHVHSFINLLSGFCLSWDAFWAFATLGCGLTGQPSQCTLAQQREHNSFWEHGHIKRYS